MEKIKKFYNPFKMWGSWLGFVIGILLVPTASVMNHVLFLHPIIWLYFLNLIQMDGENMAISAAITLPVVLFFYGWGIHSIFRKFKK